MLRNGNDDEDNNNNNNILIRIFLHHNFYIQSQSFAVATYEIVGL